MAETIFKRERKNEDGTITKMWVAEIKQNGKTKTFYGKQKQDVRAKLDDYKAKIAYDDYIKPNLVTVDKFIDKWLEITKCTSVSESTLENYKYRLNHFKDLLKDIPLQKLTPNDIQISINEMAKTLSPYNIKISYAVFKQCFKSAIDNELIKKLPFKGIELPKEIKKEKKVLSPSDIDDFKKKYSKEKLYAAFLIQIRQGLRQGEVLGLTQNDIDLTNRTIQVRQALKRKGLKLGETKTEASVRLLPMHEDVYEALSVYKAPKNNLNLLFCTRTGKPIGHRNYLRTFYRIFGKELKGNHSLRHTFTTQIMDKIGDPTVTAEILGHTTTRMVNEVYNHVNLDRMKNAIDKL